MRLRIEQAERLEIIHNVYIDVDAMEYNPNGCDAVHGWKPIPEKWLADIAEPLTCDRSGRSHNTEGTEDNTLLTIDELSDKLEEYYDNHLDDYLDDYLVECDVRDDELHVKYQGDVTRSVIVRNGVAAWYHGNQLRGIAFQCDHVYTDKIAVTAGFLLIFCELKSLTEWEPMA